MAVMVPLHTSVRQVRCTSRRRETIRRSRRAAAAVVGRDLSVVADGSSAPASADELLVLEPAGVGGALTARQGARLREAVGSVLVVRDPAGRGDGLLVLDDGTPDSLPALCAALAMCGWRGGRLVLAGPADAGGEQRAMAAEVFRHRVEDVAVADVPAPDGDGYGRVVRARGVGLFVSSLPAVRAGRLPATLPCSVLLVR